MKKSFCFAISMFMLSYFGKAQQGNALSNLKAQSQEMARAFLRRDYYAFVGYIHPAMISAAGGKLAMINAIESAMKPLQNQGAVVSAITFDPPAKMISFNKELQTIILQKTDFVIKGKKTLNSSLLIAISADGGVNWTFIDTHNKDIQLLRRVFPFISPQLATLKL